MRASLHPRLMQTLATLALLPCCSQAQTVVKLTLHDTVQPITAGYLDRGLHEAANRHADAVLISLGTPGGLLTSTREMVSSIERSTVPVIVFVEPTGARAASAGFFLLESADVAVMAPGTNTGAAHPILQGTTLDPILKKKVEEDATALLRSITAPRHRDDAAATRAILEAKSYSADEALLLHVIDFIAPDERSLLAQLDGRTITRFNGAQSTLRLAHAQIVTLPPSTRERLLTLLTNPDLAVLLLLGGLLLVFLEFNVPGAVVPGALGTLCIALALFGFNLLPIRHAAVGLLAAAALLLALEIKAGGHGVLAFVSAACLVAGLVTIVDGPPELRVHPAVAVASGLALAAISFTLTRIALQARRNKALLGAEAMRGLLAVATTALAPSGQVTVRGEIWQAALEPNQPPAAPGDALVITAVNGLTLDVRHSVPRASPHGLD